MGQLGWTTVSTNSPWEPQVTRSRRDTLSCTLSKAASGRLLTTTRVRCPKKLSLRHPSLNWLELNKLLEMRRGTSHQRRNRKGLSVSPIDFRVVLKAIKGFSGIGNNGGSKDFL